MSSGETVKQWVREVTTTDEGLVNLLIRLQTSVFSSHRGHIAGLRVTRSVRSLMTGQQSKRS